LNVSKLEKAKQYLGNKHVIAKNSTYEPNKNPVLTHWISKKLAQPVERKTQ